MGIAEDLKTTIKRRAYKAGTSSLASGMKAIAKDILRLPSFFGVFVSSAALLFWDINDYRAEKEKLALEYSNQIGAKAGKPPETVTTKDLDAATGSNQTLDQALRREKLKRNLRIVSNIASTVIGFFITGLLITNPATFLLGGAFGALMVGAAIGFGLYLAADSAITAVGKRLLHLKEPNIKDVEVNPNLQKKLSLPSQIHFLKHQQDHRAPIFPQQVMEVFDKAGSNVPISPEEIKQITKNLNDRLIDAQELAYLVYGQESGVPKREIAELNAYERMNQQLSHQLAEQKQVIQEQAVKLGHKAAELGETAKEKVASAAGAVGDWAKKLTPKKSPGEIVKDKIAQGPQSAAETVLNQRQIATQQAQGLTS